MSKMLRHKKDELLQVIEDNLDYLVRFAFYRVNDKSCAEDIVYNAVLRMLEMDLSKIKTESWRLYLFRIVYNLCQDYFNIDRINKLSTDTLEIADTDGDDALLDQEEADRINTILDSLPAREAEVIRMHVIDELTFADIGNLLSIPASTIKSRYKSGMDKLKKQYFKNDLI